MRVKRTIVYTATDIQTIPSFILNHIETQTGLKLHGNTDTDNVQGHISLSIESTKIRFWIFVYDNNGVHESENSDNLSIITQPNPRCKRPIPFPI